MTSPAALEEILKDPAKAQEVQKEISKLMEDPEKRKAMMAWQQSIEKGVEKLKSDPEMVEFFKDVEKNGMDAMKKYEKDERILRKFSEAMGGPEAMSMFAGGAGPAAAPPPAVAPNFKPGDQVIIRGLQAKPELNGRKAMVVPPTPEERAKLEGTGRLIVRIIDSGEQFAVKPDNLRTTAQEAGELVAKSLEDVSMYDPALQAEAAKLRDSGKLEALQNDPELKPILEDIKKNGMSALNKYWDDDKLIVKISRAMGMSS